MCYEWFTMRLSRSKLAALLATVFLLVAPGVAAAQSAGDEQYSDPLAGGNSSQGSSSGSGSSSSGSSSSGSSSSGSTSQAQPSTQAQSSSGHSSQLARTGFEVGIPLAAGAALLGAGLLVRRRARA
jgi:LPXTG-motif cell wall-anchored protein